MKVPYQIFLFIYAASALLFSSVYANAQNNKIGINKVVIDAGHGGQDPGAVSRNFREKDINLTTALRLGKLINKHYPDVEVIYTRKTDVFVDLYKRGDIANKANADLFISIHTNAAKNAGASGSETLVMGMDKAGKNLDVAMRENDVIVYENDYKANYQGYVPGSPESFIIFSLMQYSYQEQSLTLAGMVQKQFSKNTIMINRGVKQAPVLVLWNTGMPSILAEFGFITNSTEGAYINSEKGKDMYAQCLFNAFSEYKTLVEGRGKSIVLNEVSSADISVSEPGPLTDAQPVTLTPQTAKEQKVIYKVQIASSAKKIPKNSSVFGIYRGEAEEKIINNTYKYYLGSASSYEEALSLQKKIKNNIKDAFMVAFLNDKPIPIEEAKKLK